MKHLEASCKYPLTIHAVYMPSGCLEHCKLKHLNFAKLNWDFGKIRPRLSFFATNTLGRIHEKQLMLMEEKGHIKELQISALNYSKQNQ